MFSSCMYIYLQTVRMQHSNSKKHKHRHNQYTDFNQQKYTASVHKRKLMSQVLLFIVISVAIAVMLIVYWLYAN